MSNWSHMINSYTVGLLCNAVCTFVYTARGYPAEKGEIRTISIIVAECSARYMTRLIRTPAKWALRRACWCSYRDLEARLSGLMMTQNSHRQRRRCHSIARRRTSRLTVIDVSWNHRTHVPPIDIHHSPFIHNQSCLQTPLLTTSYTTTEEFTTMLWSANSYSPRHSEKSRRNSFICCQTTSG